MRTFTFLFSDGRRFINWPGHVIHTTQNLRTVTIALFAWKFGRPPAFHWHIHAEAGAYADAPVGPNTASVHVEQINHDYAERYPRQWILHDGVAHPYVGPTHQLKEAA